MRSRSGARITRSLRTSGARLSHEQKALEHGRARWRDSGARDQEDDRSFLRFGGAEIVAQASCLWSKWASRPFLFDSTGKMPVGPTGKMPVLQRADFYFADVELQRFPRDAQEGIGRIGQRDVL